MEPPLEEQSTPTGGAGSTPGLQLLPPPPQLTGLTGPNICYACNKPTIGGLYCSCIDHLPYGGMYANKDLIKRARAAEDLKSTDKNC